MAMEKLDDASRYAWACSVFGLAPGASAQAVRGAILSQLEDAEFMPPPAWRQAIWLLSNPQLPQAWPAADDDAFHEAAENQLAEVVDQFAANFFSLSSAQRRVKWTKLQKSVSTFPRLRARVAALQPGLDVESTVPDGQNKQDAILVERLRRLFVLKPGDQVVQRRQWLANMHGDWRPAVRRVRARFPKLAHLDNEFLSALFSANHGAAANSTAAITTKTNLAAGLVSANRPAGTIPKLSPAKSSSSASGWPNMGWVGYIAVMILISATRNCAHDNTYSPSSHRPSWTQPTPYDPTAPQPYNSAQAEWKRLIDDAVRRKFGERLNPRGSASPAPQEPTPVERAKPLPSESTWIERAVKTLGAASDPATPSQFQSPPAISLAPSGTGSPARGDVPVPAVPRGSADGR
jgi:hypothetical protein